MTVNADLTEWRRMAALLKSSEKKVATAARKGLREVAQPIGDEVGLEGADKMPHAGGLSAYLATNAKPRVLLPSVFGGVSTMSIALQDKKGGVKLRSLDRGVLRHPVFGHRSTWKLQNVPTNAWSDAFAKKKSQAVEAVEKAVRDVISNLEGGTVA